MSDTDAPDQHLAAQYRALAVELQVENEELRGALVQATFF
jgi:hypothetical protein